MAVDSINKGYKPAKEPLGKNIKKAWLFVFNANQILIKEGQDGPSIPTCQDVDELMNPEIGNQYFGELDETPCYCLEADDSVHFAAGLVYRDLRSLLGQLDQDIFVLAGRAFQLVNWSRMTKFCGKCGSVTVVQQNELVKKCPDCEALFYPRISPAVIVAIIRDDKILLAHNKSFKNNLYSVLAGFVEPGETFEECINREIMEEVGIQVTNIKYFGSQPWPFPDSLMVGFTAEYESGEISVDGLEIEAAYWYSADNLPSIPATTTIAGRLIQAFRQSVSSGQRDENGRGPFVR